MELREVLAWCMDRDVVAPFRTVVRKWIRRGVPIDPAAFWAPDPSLKIAIRQVVSAMPSMGRYRTEARLWLTEPEARFFDPENRYLAAKTAERKFKFFKPYQPQFIPWNLLLYAPAGSHYDAFNRIGFVLENA